MKEYTIKCLSDYFTNKLILNHIKDITFTEENKLNRLRYLLDLEIKARLSLLPEDTVTFEDVQRTLESNVDVKFYINLV